MKTVTPTSIAHPPENVYVGRQPIFDRNLNVYAYELLYRSASNQDKANIQDDGECATTQTILNTFVEIGLEKLVLNRLAAINLTEKFLLEDNRIPFSPRQVILEILEDIPVTPRLINSLPYRRFFRSTIGHMTHDPYGI